MIDNKKTGFWGEEIAAGYLEKKGYTILFRNWQYMHKEIDLIAQKDKELIIIEVKTRSKSSLISPAEAVTLKKQRFIIQSTNVFIEKHDINLETRFDIITIVYDNAGYSIEHIENAFYPIVK
jgi:putative endonuclease